MSWELLLWLLALFALLLLVVQLLRFLRADGDLTLLWAEWQGRRPGRTQGCRGVYLSQPVPR
ncbi:Dehydrogenase/reductase SDR member 7 [Saguinus oedipus]|uniref:Dehydrogenase/reductase SDR member 7 n=1 Tax=Saguinus oedipus TaxID=9490 RepID=A0ABQ9V4N7_SAGOE|nr:Dehydrogenase/reductase SDR member 7 [Saguinus oedipus]